MMNSLQLRINSALKRANMKPIDLARLANVSRATVSLWATGKTKNIGGDRLTRVARALNVDPHWLATGEERSRSGHLDAAESAPQYNHDEQNLLRNFRLLSNADRIRALVIVEALIKASRKDVG